MTIPVGICVSLTAESVVFTHWPPFPDARKTSNLISVGSISISTSSASGNTATVAVDVWILPPLSVSGTLWTLWTPDSYFSLEYAPFPIIMKTISLYPPIPISFDDIVSTLKPHLSAYLTYCL